MSTIIRKYIESDREKCRSLWKELVEWHREIYQNPKIGGDHPEDYFNKHLSVVGPERIWIAQYDSRIVGFIGLIVKDDEAEIEPHNRRQTLSKQRNREAACKNNYFGSPKNENSIS